MSAPYYIIQGKQSIQTIQDAKLFHLNRFFTIHKRLSKLEYDSFIHQLLQENSLEINDSTYTLSSEAKEKAYQLEQEIMSYHLNGIAFHKIDTMFLERLLLLVQVWTNKSINNQSYIPIVENRDIEYWVKSVYYKTKNEVNHYLHLLHDELLAILKGLSSQEANIFVDQITNAYNIGSSDQQLSEKYNLSSVDVELMRTNIVHFLLTHIKEAQHKLLYTIALQKEEHVIQLTESTRKTYMLWKQGYDLTHIANMRQLKLNTIYDHIVEIALHKEHFPYDHFISQAEMAEIKRAVHETNSFKLKEIKQKVSNNISYFQVRLALTNLQ